MAETSAYGSLLLRIAVVGVVAYAAVLLLMYLLQERLFYLPSLPGRELTATPQQIGLAYDDVMLETDDGETLHGWYVPSQQARGTVLIFHGNAGNISHRLDTLRTWHALGLDALIIDYRGYGRSSGRPTEQGTYRDARAAWRHLVDTRGIAPERIVIFGRSLGGAVAVRLAAEVAPAGVIVESTFTSVPDVAAELYPWLPVRLLARLQYPTERRITEVTAPVLVVHSPNDEIIGFHHGEALYAAAREPKAFLEIDGDHNTGFIISADRYIQGLSQFLDSTL